MSFVVSTNLTSIHFSWNSFLISNSFSTRKILYIIFIYSILSQSFAFFLLNKYMWYLAHNLYFYLNQPKQIWINKSTIYHNLLKGEIFCSVQCIKACLVNTSSKKITYGLFEKTFIAYYTNYLITTMRI